MFDDRTTRRELANRPKIRHGKILEGAEFLFDGFGGQAALRHAVKFDPIARVEHGVFAQTRQGA